MVRNAQTTLDFIPSFASDDKRLALKFPLSKGLEFNLLVCRQKFSVRATSYARGVLLGASPTISAQPSERIVLTSVDTSSERT
jgi:hypothetical protein